MIVDVRSTEEYIKNHIKGALNMPLFTLENYVDFLEGKEVLLYCDSGHRAAIAVELLKTHGIQARSISDEAFDKYEKEAKSIICAINYLSAKPGVEEEFEQKVKELCHVTTGMRGFLGSKIFTVSTISYGGSGLRGEYEDIDVKPTKYVMLTYWTSKEAHEEFHKQPVIMEGFMSLLKYLSIMPYEEFAEVMR